MTEFERRLQKQGIAYLSTQAIYAFAAVAYGLISIAFLLILNDTEMAWEWIITVLAAQVTSCALRYFNDKLFKTEKQQLIFGVAINAIDAIIISSCLIFVPYIGHGLSIYMMGVLLIICLGCPMTSACCKPLLWGFATPFLSCQIVAWLYYYIKFEETIFFAALILTSAEFLLLKKFIFTYLFESKSSFEAQIEAERATKSKSRFFVASTHDLRQPLFAAAAVMSVLKKRNKDETLKSLIDESIHMINTVDRQISPLMELSRLDSDSFKINKTQVDLIELVSDVIAINQPKLKKDLEVTTDFQVTDAAVSSDKTLLMRAINNLLDNSIKYTDKGTINIQLSPYQSSYKLVIQDTGIGIDDSKLDVIFDEFYQINNPDRDPKKGFGLGLPIVLRVCEKLGVKLSIKSKAGKYTKVTLITPKNS